MAVPAAAVVASVVLLAGAGVAFVATNGDDDKGVIANVAQAPVPTKTVEPKPEPTKQAKPKPQVKRGNIFVEVYNNSNIAGLAGKVAEKADGAGWKVVGSDNWRGTIPASTIYYPERLKRAAKQLSKDLGVKRLMPAVDPMRGDRLTVILTPDYVS